MKFVYAVYALFLFNCVYGAWAPYIYCLLPKEGR